jgi:hypothetical protein
MKFEYEAPDCTWMTFPHMQGVQNFKICEFMDLLREFDLIDFVLNFDYLELDY